MDAGNPVEETKSIEPVDVAEVKKQPTKKTKVFITIAVAITVLFLGAGATAYTKFVVNNPEKIWEKALQNTSEGYKEIIKLASETPAKGGKVEGSFMTTSPIGAEGKLNGGWYEKNSQFSGNITVSGINATTELRTINSEGSVNPDIYFKLDGLEGALPLIESLKPELAPMIRMINGNWYMVDSTLLSTLVPEGSQAAVKEISPAEISDIASKISVVLDERLFTVDNSRAAVVVEKSIGREKFAGHDSYKYSLTIQKQQLVDLTAAIKEVLRGTVLEDLSNDMMAGSNGVSETGIDGLLDNIEGEAGTTYAAEAWVDAKFKYIRNVRITPIDKDGKSQGYIDFGLDYSGGDSWPFSISLNSVASDDSDDKMSAVFSVELNKVSKNLELGVNVSGTVEKQQISGDGKLTISPSNDPLTVDKPVDAKNILELLGLASGSDKLSLNETMLDSFRLDPYPIDDVELQ